MSPSFDATDIALHMQESESRSRVAIARIEKIESDLRGHIERESGIWRDVRGIKWTIRVMIPLVLALAGLMPWVLRHVVADALESAGVVKTSPAWQDRNP